MKLYVNIIDGNDINNVIDVLKLTENDIDIYYFLVHGDTSELYNYIAYIFPENNWKDIQVTNVIECFNYIKCIVLVY